MNTIWSDYIQSINTLYLSRTLRFSDTYKENYMNFFNIGNKKDILEIGCGPGALTNSLSRWYPNTNIIGIDRDTSFIEFAKQKMPHLKFIGALMQPLYLLKIILLMLLFLTLFKNTFLPKNSLTNNLES